MIERNEDWWTLRRALRAFGEESQKQMMIGEIGEYLTLVGREAQGRATVEEWVDETADLMILCHQMALVYGLERVRIRVREKMDRLDGIVNKRLELKVIDGTASDPGQ